VQVIELEISRFPRKELPYMPGSQTTQGRLDTRAGVSDRVAFRVSYLVGTLREITFAAQWLAYTLPCRRFADTLTDACARLGANADRYSFIATDSHRLLLAGLPAHNLVILRGDEMAELPTDAVNSRCRPVSAGREGRLPRRQSVDRSIRLLDGL
jgi:hypothetical protein